MTAPHSLGRVAQPLREGGPEDGIKNARSRLFRVHALQRPCAGPMELFCRARALYTRVRGIVMRRHDRARGGFIKGFLMSLGLLFLVCIGLAAVFMVVGGQRVSTSPQPLMAMPRPSGSPPEPGDAESPESTGMGPNGVGTRVTLSRPGETGDGDTLFFVFDRKNLSVLRGKEPGRLTSLKAGDGARGVENGTHAVVVAALDDDRRVKILEGPQKDQVGWVDVRYTTTAEDDPSSVDSREKPQSNGKEP